MSGDKPSREDDREARLAAALRDNLRRRKAGARTAKAASAKAEAARKTDKSESTSS